MQMPLNLRQHPVSDRRCCGARAHWGDHAAEVAEHGFSPVIVKAGTKEPLYPKWQMACYLPPVPAFIAKHATGRGRNDSVGIACGQLRDGKKEIGWLIAIDCDAGSQTRSSEIRDAIVEHLGESPLVRFGRPNRWVRLYRSETPTASYRLGDLEILGVGRQFVAFGIHPNTGKPYGWQDGDPGDVKAKELPVVSQKKLEGLLRAFGHHEQGRISESTTRRFTSHQGVEVSVPDAGSGQLLWTKDERGLVIDGRDAFLTWCLAKTGGHAEAAFALFEDHADLSRPKRDTRRAWTLKDAQVKARTFVRRSRQGLVKHAVRGRPAQGDWSGRPWSDDGIAALIEHTDRLLLQRKITQTERAVAVAMAEFLKDKGQCFASVGTIAKGAGVTSSAVKNARRRLVTLGLWKASETVGKMPAYVPIFKPTQTPVAKQKSNRPVQSQVPNTSKVPSVALRQGMVPSNDNRGIVRVGRKPVQLDLFQGEPKLSDPLAFGHHLRRERLKRGLTQQGMAEYLSCRRSHIANVERGHDRLSHWAHQRFLELTRSAA
ncbi:bifunctional DNA primase/polymerase [Methylobacterium sp. J-026]|uniref:bifunctional DNA primase/polymerase n=1 Tax=Methylobacterium sp. J-026 TaxID=2836624 RepID=UPI001FBB9B49|nr:bifunctional DNA primase/polymerase [Methylobacterium sp. J-026]MCJ2134977.1 bifunctional DNA primase/polymerase [Methylobacterium sp. J-026]